MISKRLKDLRDKTGWSQSELARRLGKTRNYVALLETEKRKNPSEDFLARLDLVERGHEVISAIQIPSSLAKQDSHQTDSEWLIERGYGDNLANIARELRRAIEARHNKQGGQ